MSINCLQKTDITNLPINFFPIHIVKTSRPLPKTLNDLVYQTNHLRLGASARLLFLLSLFHTHTHKKAGTGQWARQQTTNKTNTDSHASRRCVQNVNIDFLLLLYGDFLCFALLISLFNQSPHIHQIFVFSFFHKNLMKSNFMEKFTHKLTVD